MHPDLESMGNILESDEKGRANPKEIQPPMFSFSASQTFPNPTLLNSGILWSSETSIQILTTLQIEVNHKRFRFHSCQGRKFQAIEDGKKNY